MRDLLFIRVESSRSFFELSPVNRKGGSTCVGSSRSDSVRVGSSRSDGVRV